MKEHEVIGKLTKQEKVSPIERNKLKNTFVVNIPSPISTYFNRFSHINKPNTVLLITSKPVSFERILRATSTINNGHDYNIDGAKCEITIGKKKYSGIRIKGLDQFTHIPEIQELYKKEGFDFAREVRIKPESDSMIRINKFFKLQEIKDNIYHSTHDKDRYYMVIPKDLTWDEFRDLTLDIKNNVNISGYDVAKGIFYTNNGITEMIRIIKPDITLDMVKEIHNKYLDRLS